MLHTLTDPSALKLLMTDDLYLVPEINRYDQFDYLGENNKFFLIINHDPAEKYISKPENEMLEKILQAAKIDPKDIALINISRYPGIRIHTLKAYFACSRIVLLHTDPSIIGIRETFSPYEVCRQEDFSFFFGRSLRELANSMDEKKLFWTAFQNLLK